MKKLFLTLFIGISLYAQNNTTKKKSNSVDNNSSFLKKNIQKMIEKEKKYKVEQKFYMGDDYNLTEHEVDSKIIKKVPLIEPEYDFDITDIYTD